MRPITTTEYRFDRVAAQLAGKRYWFTGSVVLHYDGTGWWAPGEIRSTDERLPGHTTVMHPQTEAHAALARALWAQRSEDMAEAIRKDFEDGDGRFRLFGEYPPAYAGAARRPNPGHYGAALAA